MVTRPARLGQSTGVRDMNAIEKFNQRATAVDSLLCVGLDSDFNRLPEAYIHYEYPLFSFNRSLIEQTHTYVAAYKPNIASYEPSAGRGLSSLRVTLEYLQQNRPDLLPICNAKRGDIGTTSRAYAHAIF